MNLFLVVALSMSIFSCALYSDISSAAAAAGGHRLGGAAASRTPVERLREYIDDWDGSVEEARDFDDNLSILSGASSGGRRLLDEYQKLISGGGEREVCDKRCELLHHFASLLDSFPRAKSDSFRSHLLVLLRTLPVAFGWNMCKAIGLKYDPSYRSDSSDDESACSWCHNEFKADGLTKYKCSRCSSKVCSECYPKAARWSMANGRKCLQCREVPIDYVKVTSISRREGERRALHGEVRRAAEARAAAAGSAVSSGAASGSASGSGTINGGASGSGTASATSGAASGR